MPEKTSSSKNTTTSKTASSNGGRSAAARKREEQKRAELKKKQQRIARAKEITLIVVAGIMILMFVSCFVDSLSWLKDFSYKVFGIMMYVMPFVIIGLAFLVLYSAVNGRMLRKILAGLICLFALQGILSVAIAKEAGGLLGRANHSLLYGVLGSVGMYVVDVIIFAIGVVLFTDYSVTDFFRKPDEEEDEDIRKAREEALRAQEERARAREEKRNLKRKNAELRKSAKAREEVERLRDENKKLSREVEENERRLRENRDRFSPVYGIGNTKISDTDPEPETTVYRPDDKEKAGKTPSAGKYADSGAEDKKNNAPKDVGSEDFPEIHVPTEYFKNQEEDDELTEIVIPEKEISGGKDNPEKASPASLFEEENAGDEYVRKVISPAEKKEGYSDNLKPEELYQNGQETRSASGNNGVSPKPEKLKSDPEEDRRTAEQIEESIIKEPEKEYEIPPARLLTRGSGAAISRAALQEELKDNAAKLQATLKTFGVEVKITNISCGPAVTRYEIQPASGVKVSKIVSLTDDIKLNLAAADIRMEAPIPGKSAIGIEIPNKVKQSVILRDILESEAFQNTKSKLAFAAGRDIEGNTVIADIAKMPHVLVAGATGSGKSVCINSIIMSILYHAKPTEVKMIMVDPKVVELSVYNGIPHLLLPVVTDPKKAASALNWAVAEMERRYQQFADYSVRNSEGFNHMVDADAPVDENGEPLQKMPQILIIVDELADLMMVAANDVESAIIRLAQKARAAGIHLVLATQRPSVDVITGLIKANIPSRIAFAVSSGTDSRTILDMNGAEKLLGMGDMLYAPAGASKPIRVQGSFVSDEDVKKVVDYICSKGPVKGGSVSRDINLEQSAAASGAAGLSERDEYFADAGRLVIEKEKASIGMLQRAFKLGFNRAARIVDQLADAGVVGEEEGTKPRRVLMKAEEFETYLSTHTE